MNTVKINSKSVRMIAHRGLSGIEKENTYPAFIAAGNRSYYGIETDVHKTADGEFVIIHDETTERVSGGKINIDVEKSSYDALKDIVLPDTDGSLGRKDIKIPLLRDYIRICKKYEKVCVLELKNPFSKTDIVKITEIIRSENYLNGMIYISFDMENCVKLREILPDAKIQWLVGKDVTENDIETLKKHRLDVDVYYHVLTKEIVARLHSMGMEINCWTCDSEQDAQKLIEMGVDYITSNILE